MSKEKTIITRWVCGQHFDGPFDVGCLEFVETAKTLTIVDGPGGINKRACQRLLDYNSRYDKSDTRLHETREAAIAWKIAALQKERSASILRTSNIEHDIKEVEAP